MGIIVVVTVYFIFNNLQYSYSKFISFLSFDIYRIYIYIFIMCWLFI